MAIKDLPDGGYEVRVSKVINGRQRFRRAAYISTKGEARAIESRFEVELLEEKRRLETSVTWQTAIQQYFRFLELNKATSTLYSAKTALVAHTGVWVERPISEIDENDIKALIENRLSDKKIATKSNLAKYIRGVFKVALEKRQVQFNPANLVSYKKDKMSKLQAMSRQEIVHLLAATREMNHPWYPIFRVVYELGLRSGEAIALTWEQIDFEVNTVRIDRAWCSKKKGIGATKTGEGRTLVLNKSLATFLREMKLKNPQSENVLPQFMEWKQGKAARILNSIQKDLEIRKTNFHSLRASFITHLLLAGKPVTVVQALVGHKDLKTTERYVRLIASDLKGATDALAIDFEELEKEGKILPFKKA